MVTQQAIPAMKSVANIGPPSIHRSLCFRPKIDLLRSFIPIDVPNKDCAAFVVDEDFDSIPDMGRSIDSSIFVMRHTTFDTADFLKHIGPALHRRYLAA
ncbi:MAG: hypothetical protein AAB658_00590 [Chloroflexota bacterium]